MRADTCHSWGAGATPLLDASVGVPQICCMSTKKESAEARKQRLAKALKANIARRKAQARQRPAAGRDKPE